MYEINFINPNFFSFRTTEIFVNDSLFSFYETFRSNQRLIFRFKLLVSRRVQRYLNSINSDITIRIPVGSTNSLPVSVLLNNTYPTLTGDRYDQQRPITYVVPSDERNAQHFLNFIFSGNMHKNTILMEGGIGAPGTQVLANEVVIKAFNEAIEFILALKANTIPIMRTISELATFRGLPPNPETETNSNKKIQGQQTLTNDDRLDALQLVSQNQTGFVRLNANDLPIDMLRKIKNNM